MQVKLWDIDQSAFLLLKIALEFVDKEGLRVFSHFVNVQILFCST